MIEYKKMYIMCLNYRWNFIKDNICYYMKRINEGLYKGYY
ncbi:adenylosuccinate lyase [Clostridium botulinum]|nr:adenylosuccinate lyase [Clostridium botulinum]NFG70043.1 adenylosuccinate lyase [Clostridium sporogenes]MBO0527318.1 adenylosuccinate lyase [Clostridium botulinum]MBO0533124.1 adenylosuccinate lyase [Clostridium botulinum]MBO0534192.1 adenylosuccinate lyase [Clostridium botulinum]